MLTFLDPAKADKLNHTTKLSFFRDIREHGYPLVSRSFRETTPLSATSREKQPAMQTHDAEEITRK